MNHPLIHRTFARSQLCGIVVVRLRYYCNRASKKAGRDIGGGSGITLPAVKAEGDQTSLLGRDLFGREARHVGVLAGVLNSNPADVAVLVYVQNSLGDDRRPTRMRPSF